LFIELELLPALTPLVGRDDTLWLGAALLTLLLTAALF
jgi:hypothetical protein